MWPPEWQQRRPQEPRRGVLAAAAVPLQHVKQPREQQRQQQSWAVWHQPAAVAGRLSSLGRGCQGQVCAHVPEKGLHEGASLAGQPGTAPSVQHVLQLIPVAAGAGMCAVLTAQRPSGCTLWARGRNPSGCTGPATSLQGSRRVSCLLLTVTCRCHELVQDIMSAPPDASVVRMVDDISDTVSATTGTNTC